MTPGLGIEPGTHWWEASALTTAPPQLSEGSWGGVKEDRLRLKGESLFLGRISTKKKIRSSPKECDKFTRHCCTVLYCVSVSLVSMVHTRPTILRLVLMLIMKLVTSPPVRFQSLVGRERIPVRVIKYVNLSFDAFFPSFSLAESPPRGLQITAYK